MATKSKIENPYLGWTAEDRSGALAQAIINCMYDIDNVEKNTEVGKGSYGYKGVSDKDVKITVRKAMAAHGLAILPIKVTPRTDVMVWQSDGSRKQQVFVEVTTQYKLLHVSGAFEMLEGVGHGVDAMDKGAGKATTYALKYTLLYLFLIPSGSIDDADRMHSNEIDPPQAPPVEPTTKEPLQKTEPVAQPKVTKEKAKGTAKPKTESLVKGEPEYPEMVDVEVNGLKPLNKSRFDKILERVKAGEPGVLTGVRENLHHTEAQLEYLRYFMPKAEDVKTMTKEEPEPETTAVKWERPGLNEDGTKPSIHPKEMMARLEAFKAGDHSALEFIEDYELKEGQTQVVQNYRDHIAKK